jgi:hypothetical protein
MADVKAHVGGFSWFIRKYGSGPFQSVMRDKDQLHLIICPNMSPNQLERGVNHVFGAFSLSGFLSWTIAGLIGLVVGGSIVLFLSLLEIFNQQFEYVAYQFSMPPGVLERAYLIGVLVLGALAFSFIPQLASRSDEAAGTSVVR